MYTVGLESDTRAYFTGVTILISLPTGTKIFNWLFTYLSNPPLLHLRITSVFLSHLFLLMFTVGGSTGIILGNGAVDRLCVTIKKKIIIIPENQVFGL